MKAIVYNQYGGPEVLEYKDVPSPSPPKANEALVRIRAASVAAGECHVLSGFFIIRLITGGIFRPKKDSPVGCDFSGVIEAVGDIDSPDEETKKFVPGAEVFGSTKFPHCGTLAEYITVPVKCMVIKPPNLTHEQAAAIPVSGGTALEGLRNAAKLEPGKTVLINGASGGVGTFAIQIAKALGASVTAVVSTPKTELAKSLGADQVIDYTKEDFCAGGNRTYDVIFDIAGNRELRDIRKVMSHGDSGSKYISCGGAPSTFISRQLKIMLTNMFSSKKQSYSSLLHHPSQEKLIGLRKMAEEGNLMPVVEKTFLLSQAAEALKIVKDGHAKGKLVLMM